jgi:hypothetical protein
VGLYLLHLHLHGLLRGQNLELGRDPDTGGQTTYVLQLTRALAARPEVERVEVVPAAGQDLIALQVQRSNVRHLKQGADSEALQWRWNKWRSDKPSEL